MVCFDSLQWCRLLGNRQGLLGFIVSSFESEDIDKIEFIYSLKHMSIYIQ